MFIKQVDKFTKVLIDRKIITIANKERINYGLSTGVELILNLIATLKIGLILDMVLESIVFVLSFASIRVYAGGYHLRKALNCYFVSNGSVALVLLTVKMTPKEYLGSISFILLAISIPIILKFAPIGTPNKPLSNYEKECFRNKVIKHSGFELLVVLGLYVTNMLKSVLIINFAIFISSLLIILSVYEE